MSLAGKVALVTGGGRGIGKGCAIELARKGADVLITDRPDSPDIDPTIKELKSLGVKAWGIRGDAFVRSEIEKSVNEAIELAGGIDILVHNPAKSKRVPFLEFDPADWESSIAAVLSSGFHTSQLVARQMVKQGRGGSIVFISSVHAEMPYGPCVAYNAGKAGLNHFARSIAVELAPHKIRCNSIDPGWIDTPNERATFTQEQFDEWIPKIPLGRIGTPQDIGAAAAFLSSEEASYISGTVMRVDGMFVYKEA
ncbi:MAG: SDR family oxidoreductase [Planctomycetota bacterium]|nr:SDR family oxidoreductase [Planctomycetota bacterium]MDA1214499.1 SDR family oxidoreductase [Planctomycetota bacterium]